MASQSLDSSSKDIGWIKKPRNFAQARLEIQLQVDRDPRWDLHFLFSQQFENTLQPALQWWMRAHSPNIT